MKFFFKLPRTYQIKTPLGRYNPDWAVILEKTKRVYFVAETKAFLEKDKLRDAEKFKIKCGEKFFALAKDNDVTYSVATSLDDLR